MNCYRNRGQIVDDKQYTLVSNLKNFSWLICNVLINETLMEILRNVYVTFRIEQMSYNSSTVGGIASASRELRNEIFARRGRGDD